MRQYEHEWHEQKNMLGYSQGYKVCHTCGERRLMKWR